MCDSVVLPARAVPVYRRSVCILSPTMIMRPVTTCAVLALLAVSTLSTSGGAQGLAPLDSAQRAAMMATALEAGKPAAFVLQHASELALSPTQVAALKALAVVQRDSTSAREARLVTRMQSTIPSPAMIALGSWTGDIDEPLLRDALCQQSTNQLDLMLGLAWDRRAVAALLTPAQVSQLPQLQISDMMKAVGRP